MFVYFYGFILGDHHCVIIFFNARHTHILGKNHNFGRRVQCNACQAPRPWLSGAAQAFVSSDAQCVLPFPIGHYCRLCWKNDPSILSVLKSPKTLCPLHPMASRFETAVVLAKLPASSAEIQNGRVFETKQGCFNFFELRPAPVMLDFIVLILIFFRSMSVCIFLFRLKHFVSIAT